MQRHKETAGQLEVQQCYKKKSEERAAKPRELYDKKSLNYPKQI